MKKRALFILAVLLIGFISIQIIKAQEENVPGLPSGLQPGQMETSKEDIENKTNYLQKEWRNILLKNPVGKVVVKIWDFLKKPLTIITGTNAEVSWKFAIAIGIWITVFFLVFKLLKLSLLPSWAVLLISLTGTIMISATKAIDKLSGWLDTLAGKWWGKAIILFAIIAIIAVSSVLWKIAKKNKEKQEKEKTETAQQVVQKTAEGITGKKL